tara:strand:+ start:199953 stop:201674 length:1722 start_codon:yes stop_codon:yes gene_type:complete
MKFQLDRDEINDNAQKLIDWVKSSELDCLYISSFDIHLNEYVPLYDNLRYLFTGFSGSVAEVLCTKDEIFLFVDGRYHEQVDNECEAPVRPIKVSFDDTLHESLKTQIRSRQFHKIGVVSERTSVSFYNDLRSMLDVETIGEAELISLIKYPVNEGQHTLEYLGIELTGEGQLSKFKKVCHEEKSSYFVCALDTISWLTNIRGYELPYQATFKSKCMVTKDCLYLFSTQENVKQARELKIDGLSWHNFSEMEQVLSSLTHSLEKVYYDPNKTTVKDIQTLDKSFGHDKTYQDPNGLTHFHANKNETEIKGFEKSFENSDNAIWNTINWMKRECQKRDVTEFEFYTQAGLEYSKVGAKAQSFHTIAGFGASSSIIHFGNSSKEKNYVEGELILMDSGAFYEHGLATDCTRAFIGKGEAQDWQKEIYTLVLKGLLLVQGSTFKEGTLGEEIDEIARRPIKEAGYDYAHGTGHGVGINVHEGCYRLKPGSKIPLKEGLVGSIEPGIYLPGKGGVRLENIAVIEKLHPDRDLLKFRPLVFIGFETDLIDFSMLDEKEKELLQTYEEECTKRGRSLLF